MQKQKQKRKKKRTDSTDPLPPSSSSSSSPESYGYPGLRGIPTMYYGLYLVRRESPSNLPSAITLMMSIITISPSLVPSYAVNLPSHRSAPTSSALATRRATLFFPATTSLPSHDCYWTAMPHPCLASDSRCSSRVSELH